MPKNLFQDMVQVKRARQAKINPQPMKEVPSDVRSEPVPRQINPRDYRDEIIKEVTFEKAGPTGKHRYGLWFVAIISILFFLFAISFLFSRAEVSVNPKITDITLNQNLSASKNATGDDLGFDVVVISGTESKTVQATGQKNVSLKAEGTIILYNNFSSAAQKLDINTRLSGSNGKIYETEKAVTVPGKLSNGTPGSVTVAISASTAGAEYNSDPLDFQIIGFKGTSKYGKFYARSSGDITGGFVGDASVLSDTDKTSTVSDLTDTLQADLLKKATNQIPSGFILFQNATLLNIDETDIPPAATADNMVPVTLKGTLYGILFNEKSLTKKIAENNITNYDESDVYIPHIQNITFSLANKTDLLFADVQAINFNLSGAAQIVSRVDIDKLTTDLEGIAKKDFNSVLANYTNIDSANLSLSPIWASSLPGKAKDIKITVNYPN